MRVLRLRGSEILATGAPTSYMRRLPLTLFFESNVLCFPWLLQTIAGCQPLGRGHADYMLKILVGRLSSRSYRTYRSGNDANPGCW